MKEKYSDIELRDGLHRMLAIAAEGVGRTQDVAERVLGIAPTTREPAPKPDSGTKHEPR